MAKKNKKNKSEKSRVEVLIESLEYTHEGLADAMLQQPQLYLQAGEYHVEKMSARAAAEAELKDDEAVAAKRCREEADDAGRKVTVQAVNEFVDSDDDVRRSRKAVLLAKEEELYAKYLVDSYAQRSSMLRARVQLVGAEAAKGSGFVNEALNRLGLDRLRDEVKEKFSE